MEVATPAQAEYLAMEMELLEAGAGQRKVRAVTTVSTTQVLLMITRGSLKARVYYFQPLNCLCKHLFLSIAHI